METEVLIVLLGAGCGYALGRSVGWLAIAFLLFIAHPAQAQPWYYVNLSWAPSETIGADCRVQYNNGGSWANYGSTVSGQYANLGNGQWTGYKFRLYRDSIGIISGETTLCYGGAGWTTNGSTISWSFPNVDWGTAYSGSPPPTYSSGQCWTNNGVRPVRIKVNYSAYFSAFSEVIDPGKWFCWTNSTTNGPWSHYTETMGMGDGGEFVFSTSSTNSAVTNTPAVGGAVVDQSTPQSRQTDNQRAGLGSTNPVSGGQIQSNLVGLADQNRLNSESELRVLDLIRSNTAAALSNLAGIASNTGASLVTMDSNGAWGLGMNASGMVRAMTGAVSVAFKTNLDGVSGGADPGLWMMPVPTNLNQPQNMWNLNPRNTWIWGNCDWFRITLLWGTVLFCVYRSWRIANDCLDRILSYLAGIGGNVVKAALGAVAGLIPGVPGLLLKAAMLGITVLGAVIPIAVGWLSSIDAFYPYGVGPLSSQLIAFLTPEAQAWVGEIFDLANSWLPIPETLLLVGFIFVWEVVAASLAAFACLFLKGMSGLGGGF